MKKFNGRGEPPRELTGTANVAINNSNMGAAMISFPGGTFDSTPNVQVTPYFGTYIASLSGAPSLTAATIIGRTYNDGVQTRTIQVSWVARSGSSVAAGPMAMAAAEEPRAAKTMSAKSARTFAAADEGDPTEPDPEPTDPEPTDPEPTDPEPPGPRPGCLGVAICHTEGCWNQDYPIYYLPYFYIDDDIWFPVTDCWCGACSTPMPDVSFLPDPDYVDPNA